jgi:hypothetical protein
MPWFRLSNIVLPAAGLVLAVLGGSMPILGHEMDRLPPDKDEPSEL